MRKNLSKELELNPWSLSPQVTTLSTRPWFLGRYTIRYWIFPSITSPLLHYRKLITMHKSHRQLWVLMAWAWWYYSEWRLHDLSLKPIKSSLNMLTTEDRQEWALSNIWAYNFMGVYLYWMNECFPHWILSPYSWPINKQHLMMYRLYHWWFTFSTNNIGKENNWLEDCGTLFVLTPAIS